DEIGGELRFDDARAAACAGSAWLQLRDGKAAQEPLRSAVDAYEAISTGDEFIAPLYGARADLASAALLAGKIDVAEDALSKLCDLGPQHQVSVVEARMRRVLGVAGQRPESLPLAGRVAEWLA